MKQLVKSTIRLFLVAATCVGCAIFGSNDDPVRKSKDVKFAVPGSPFEQVDISTADNVWQSTKTGNTIALNSMCQKYSDLTLDILQKNILAGVEELKIKSSESVDFDGREAQRIRADGKTDGVPIGIDLLILKKNNCTYDITYIARQKTFTAEHGYFENFLKGFKAP